VLNRTWSGRLFAFSALGLWSIKDADPGPVLNYSVGNMSFRNSELLKEGTRHLQGVDEAVIRNIEAVRDLAKIVRTSMGPQGMLVNLDL
jgi:hypothetical protein